jgi:hypothetical protein
VGGSVPYRIEVGGLPWTDPDSGERWETDVDYATGGMSVAEPGARIRNTNRDPLYRTLRVGDGIHFVLPVDGLGPYRVRLHFAEVADGVRTGDRVFDVLLEGGVARIANLDVYRESGGDRRALVRDLYVLVDDGVLNIDFVSSKGSPPMISAIEVLEGGTPPVSPKVKRRRR